MASACRIVLVRPRYPENMGAVARAMRVTGFSELVLVSPGPLAVPSHDQARKLAVGSAVVLDAARQALSLAEAVEGCELVIGTSARAGQSGVVLPRDAARRVVDACGSRVGVAVVFGDERTGLRKSELACCTEVVRIPMVANEPSLNLAQAAMVILYELMVAALQGEPVHHPGSGRAAIVPR